jgi:hypothetical protein
MNRAVAASLPPRPFAVPGRRETTDMSGPIVRFAVRAAAVLAALGPGLAGCEAGTEVRPAAPVVVAQAGGDGISADAYRRMKGAGPGDLTAQRTAGGVRLAWSPPDPDGEHVVARYRVVAIDPDGIETVVGETAGTRLTVSGAAARSGMRYTVRAVWRSGTESDVSGVVTAP